MMQNKLVGIISKPSERRHIHEVRVVLPWLKKKSELLSGCEEEVLNDVVKNCSYMKAHRDDVIVVQGDKGDCFYIILSGQTSVYIDTIKSDTESLTENPETSVEVSMDQNADDQNAEEEDINGESKKNKQLDRSKYGKFIIHFDSGKSFGEIALISEDSVRNATVIADEETDLLVIHRDLFNRSMKAQQEKEYEERKEFISKCRLFSGWSTRFKHLLEMSVRKEVYPFGTHIMKQGEPVTGLYFIVSGQVKVVTNPSRHVQQYPALLKTTSPIEQEFGRQNKENLDKKQSNGLIQQQIRVRREEGYAAAERRQMSKTIDLCCVEGQEIQGDIETVMEMPTCAFTATCTATTTVFILDDKNYERLVLRKNTHTIQRLKEGVLRKLHGRLATPNGSLIPLLKIVHNKLNEELKPKVRISAKKEILENDKQVVISQMVKLYMQGKTPLIDPLLPDSFHHRLMTEKKNKQMESRARKKIEQDRMFRKRHRTVPRSLKQLQNSMAEAELMYPEDWPATASPNKDRALRPRTAIGYEESSVFDSSPTIRPKTAIGSNHGAGNGLFHLTQCESTDSFGTNIAKIKSMSVTEDYDQIFQHIDSLQREKNDTRAKVICNSAAKAEIKHEVERAQLGFPSEDIFNDPDDDYFDWETSATNLKTLEDKIRDFCSTVSTRRNSDPLKINEMKSFRLQGQDSVPMAGGTVFVKRKPCIYPRSAKISTDAHQHIRRFMVTRQAMSSSYSMNNRPKSSASRPKSAW